MAPIGCNFAERNEHKSALVQPRMWQDETLCVRNLTAIIEEIQVEHARCIWCTASTPKVSFEGLQHRQESARTQIGGQRRDRVNKPGLNGSRNRFRVIPRRPGGNADAGCFEPRECGCECFTRRTESSTCQIAADSDQDHGAALTFLARLDPPGAV